MKKLLTVIFSATLLMASFGCTQAEAATSPETATCIGSSPCRACKNCKYCKRCNSGGSCGVCR